MTRTEYYVRGCTALLDAIGGAIHHIGNVHKYAREEDRPEKTLFVITTDGMENARGNSCSLITIARRSEICMIDPESILKVSADYPIWRKGSMLDASTRNYSYPIMTLRNAPGPLRR